MKAVLTESRQLLCSFVILPDALGLRNRFPHMIYLVAGTQAAKEQENFIAILKLAGLKQEGAASAQPDLSDDEADDPDARCWLLIMMQLCFHCSCLPQLAQPSVSLPLLQAGRRAASRWQDRLALPAFCPSRVGAARQEHASEANLASHTEWGWHGPGTASLAPHAIYVQHTELHMHCANACRAHRCSCPPVPGECRWWRSSQAAHLLIMEIVKGDLLQVFDIASPLAKLQPLLAVDNRSVSLVRAYPPQYQFRQQQVGLDGQPQ